MTEKTILETEEERTRRGYEVQPDSEGDGDDWSNCEEFESSAH